MIVKSDISVAGAEDGRAASSVPRPPTTATPMAESLKMVTKQLLQAPSATDMVATDVRTPPKVKSQVKTSDSANTDFVPLGKGEAQPVIMEDPAGYEIITAPPVRHSTPQTEGLSTWILLSNGEQSTSSTNNKKKAPQTTEDPKKVHKPTMATPTIEKVKKPETKPTQNKPIALALKKQNVTKDKEDPPKTSTIILQDPKFKNKTPVVVGKPPSQNKTEPVKKVAVSTTTPTILTRRRPITLNPTPPTRQVYHAVPTTSFKLESSPIEAETSTTEANKEENKSTRRPTTNKKKKKNKNRRKRPTKDAEGAESKVEETSVSPPSTKIENNRPLSTTFYNYLAREVMPSVGVGLVGLVLTAGLAGLFLYPFGGGIARRNYDKGPSHIADHQMYYYNSYTPQPERDHAGGQPEETMFGQVLSSMDQNSFRPTRLDSYSANNKYRYDSQDYMHKDADYAVNGYAGSSDYSTLPDSVKNSDYEVKSDYSPKLPDYAAKTADYSLKTEYSKTPDYAIKTNDYSGKTDYSVHDSVKSTEYNLPEASKYYSMDPISSHYKLTESSSQIDNFKHEEQAYPSLTEYQSYTNAASVGTVDSYANDDKNDTTPPIGEDKSDKSQPHFSALVGSPQFTNTDFVGSVSLTGGYGAHEDMRHRTGLAVAAEHGPRNMKIEEKAKSRKRRDVHDDFSNEIDGGDDKPKPKPSTESPTTEATSTAAYIGESTTMSAKYGVSLTEENAPNTESAPESTTLPNKDGSSEKDSLPPSDQSNPIQNTPNSGGFLDFITRLAHMKLKIGISLLRTTGETLTRYMDIMAKRMEEAVRTMEKRQRTHDLNRAKRDLIKTTKKYPVIRKKAKKQQKLQ